MRNWKVSLRIYLAVALPTGLALAAALVAAAWMRHAQAVVAPISNQYLRLQNSAEEFERRVLNARIHFIYYVTIQKEGAKEKGWQHFEVARQTLPELEAAAARFGGDTMSLATQIRTDFERYEPALRQILDTVDRKENHGPEFTALINQWAALGGALVDTAGKLSRTGAQSTKVAADAATDKLASTVWLTAAGSALALLLGVLLAYLSTRTLTRLLQGIIAQLVTGADQIAAASDQVSSSAQALAQGTSQQAASVEEVSASIHEISTVATRNSDEAASADEIAARAEVEVGKANQALEESLAAMHEIAESSSAIAKIIKMVDEIAFQTNILALNAAVEAARAGAAGAGFAVVADEVRNLAQRSAGAAHDTAGLIEVANNRTGVGNRQLDGTAKLIRQILTAVQDLKLRVDHVSASSREQRAGLDQMTTAIRQIGEITQHSAASAEQSASAAHEMSVQAQTVREAASQLTALV